MVDPTAQAGPLVRVGPEGRIVIPAAFRHALGLSRGDVMTTRLEDGRVILERREAVLDELRGILAGRAGSVDDLLAWRREEAAREASEDDAP